MIGEKRGFFWFLVCPENRKHFDPNRWEIESWHYILISVSFLDTTYVCMSTDIIGEKKRKKRGFQGKFWLAVASHKEGTSYLTTEYQELTSWSVCLLPLYHQTRSRFEGARSEVYELMKRIRETPQEYRQTSPISCEGYLYVQEKRKIFIWLNLINIGGACYVHS